MNIKDYTKIILESGNPEKVNKMIDILTEELVENEENSREIELELYVLIYGEHLNEQMAIEWVSKMENNDGTKGAHWTYEQTSAALKQNKIPMTGFNEWDWYAVLNMAYSDYFYTLNGDTMKCIEFAKEWFGDKDVREGKTFRYLTEVVV